MFTHGILQGAFWFGMRLLVTRPVDDAQPLAEKLEALGHEAVILPLLQIEPRSGVSIPHVSFQAVCVSSANGLSAQLDFATLLHTPFFAIGPQSAKAARRLGFDHVHDRGGNVEGLVRTMCKSLKPADGPVLYLSGSETTGDLEGKLKAAGFVVTRMIVYDAVPASVARGDNRLDGVDGVLLYSPRTAKLWAQLIRQTEAEDLAQKLVHFCLSANVAANLPSGWVKKVSRTPDENGMLTLLDQQDEAD
jgi:uroporphyrinogen-III synthase